MATLLAKYPGDEIIKSKIDNAVWFDFTELPVKNVNKDDCIRKIGIIPFVMEDNYEWESTIGYWVNKIHEYKQNPFELKDGFQLEDFYLCANEKEMPLKKSEYDLWLSAYEYVLLYKSATKI